MRLLIDVGHTRLKWASADGGAITPGGAAPWQGADPLGALDDLWRSAGRPRQVGIAAVAGDDIVALLLRECRTRFGVQPVRLRAGAACGGVVNGYARPEQLGVDRWAALIGAWRRARGQGSVVADAGSALTIDVLDGAGVHQGGSIAPGLALACDALYRRTGWPARTGVADPRGLAGDTADAVATGTALAAAGAIEAVWRRCAGAGDVVRLWLTGGDATVLSPLLTVEHQVVPELVFEGMDQMLTEQA